MRTDGTDAFTNISAHCLNPTALLPLAQDPRQTMGNTIRNTLGKLCLFGMTSLKVAIRPPPRLVGQLLLSLSALRNKTAHASTHKMLSATLKLRAANSFYTQQSKCSRIYDMRLALHLTSKKAASDPAQALV